MQVKYGTAARIAVCGLAGLGLGFALTFALPRHYRTHVDVRVWSPDANAGAVVKEALSRKWLTETIRGAGLFEAERTAMPLEEVLESFRGGFSVRGNGDGTCQVRIDLEGRDKVTREQRFALIKMFVNASGGAARVMASGDDPVPVRRHGKSLPPLGAAAGIAVGLAARGRGRLAAKERHQKNEDAE